MRSSGVIQQESNTLPSRLEVQRLAATGSTREQSMYTSVRVLLPVALVFCVPVAAWGRDCQALAQQRDQVAGRAMKAEVARLHALRQTLCPQQEALATSDATEARPGLDYGSYIRCRQQAESELQASQPVLYTNRQGFTFFTPEGARMAREADALSTQLQRDCARSAPER
jgi:hypothetical protein